LSITSRATAASVTVVIQCRKPKYGCVNVTRIV
jgi:hypothetical protein